MIVDQVCMFPPLKGVGGMVSFQLKLAAGLAKRNIRVSYDLADPANAVILVIGGTKQIPALLAARRRGVRIVQRLNGMNWVHRARRTGVRHYLRSEINNYILQIIRRYVADFVIYQSHFAQGWWQRVFGGIKTPTTIVYNGVDLNIYSPIGTGTPPAGRTRILLVEGFLAHGYEVGIENGIALSAHIASLTARPVELQVAGVVEPATVQHWQKRAPIPVLWEGVVERAHIPEMCRSAHLFYSGDINGSCPNSVIEALACGLPVAAFDTGALTELVPPTAGCITPYGGDPWMLTPPDIPTLAGAAATILTELPRYRAGARAQAEAYLGLEAMTTGYLNVLLG